MLAAALHCVHRAATNESARLCDSAATWNKERGYESDGGAAARPAHARKDLEITPRGRELLERLARPTTAANVETARHHVPRNSDAPLTRCSKPRRRTFRSCGLLSHEGSSAASLATSWRLRDASEFQKRYVVKVGLAVSPHVGSGDLDKHHLSEEENSSFE